MEPFKCTSIVVLDKNREIVREIQVDKDTGELAEPLTQEIDQEVWCVMSPTTPGSLSPTKRLPYEWWANSA